MHTSWVPPIEASTVPVSPNVSAPASNLLTS
jgi:hypothetical protein